MFSINKYLSPRSHLIPIRNEYILDSNGYTFHVVLYYINDYKASLIIRRMDSEEGWDKKLLLKVYNIQETTNDDISIAPCNQNMFTDTITMKVKLHPADLKIQQLIPKTIMQTFKTNKAQSALHYNTILALQELNPEYEYVFFDDTDSREFIRNNFSQETLNAYDLLVPGAFKADLFRHCYLYKHGGCYFDCKMTVVLPLRNVIKPKSKMILCADQLPGAYYNAVIFTSPLHPGMKSVIELSIKNILERSYTDNVLAVTGPIALFRAIDKLSEKDKKDVEVSLKMGHTVTKYGNTVLTKAANPDYDRLRENHYSDLYNARKVYFIGPYNINNYSIYIYPHPHKDQFDFKIQDDELIIKRIDIPDSGWGQNLNIKIINNDINSVEEINVLSSDTNYIGVSLKKRVIQNRIEPRDAKLIGNHYEIKSNNDLHIVLYFIELNKFQMIVRRLDSPCEIDGFSLTIFDYNKDKFETVEIPKLTSNYYNTTQQINSVELFPLAIHPLKIPHVIVQTAETSTCRNLLHYNSVQSIIELNPEFTYLFFDQKNRRAFIQSNFDQKVLDAYDLLVPGAYQADLFRYCYIYKNGGVYIDFKSILHQPINKYVREDQEIVLTLDQIPECFTVSPLISVPNHPIMKLAIDECVGNILSQKYFGNNVKSPLEITGSGLFYKVSKMHDPMINPSLFFRNGAFHMMDENPDLKGNKIITHSYQNYYNGHTEAQNYLKKYNDREVYYMEPQIVESYKILTYPHQHPDRFGFSVNNKQLTVKRLDNSGGWGQTLQVKVINLNNHDCEIIKVSFSDSNTKVVDIYI